MKPVVLNCSRVPKYPPNSYYVGRPSIWGNPFHIGKDGTREEVIEKYRVYLQSKPNLLRKISRLKGKHLLCWCAPKPCHADVLLELANPSDGSNMNNRA